MMSSRANSLLLTAPKKLFSSAALLPLGFAIIFFLLCLLFAGSVWAADNSALNLITANNTSNNANPSGQSYSLSLQTLILLTSLSFLPTLLLMMTSFTRIIIVLSLLRQTLGAQSVPPNQILLGLALFLTFFVMSPVFDKIYVDAYQPYNENKISIDEALQKGGAPLKEFMLKQTRETDLSLFMRMSRNDKLDKPEDVPFTVLVPSFITSELKTAFQIGFSIFIPFLIIDMVVASVLMAMGMMMVSPAIFSLPFKLMLFVLVDGWSLLLGSLAQSFY
jgi:flagellar biosynthetic protein FliP